MTKPDIPPALARPAVSDDFDLDGWIAGTCGMTRTARIYQRGDLLTRLDELQAEIKIAEKTPKEQRGINDPSVDTLMDQWESLAKELEASALLLRVQDRTEERRRHLRDDLKKKGLKLDDDDDNETVLLHLLADAIIKYQVGDKVTECPDGFPVSHLRAILRKVGDTGLSDLRDAYYKVVTEAPTVSAPLSRSSSSSRGGIT